MVEDLAIFFADFARPVRINGRTRLAIFSDAFEVAVDRDIGMAAAVPTLTMSTGDVPDSVVGMTTRIDDVLYVIAEHRPNGSGLSVLLLEVA